MKIGINAVAAFKKERTGVEEYAYQILKNLTELKAPSEHEFFLYSESEHKNFINIARSEALNFLLGGKFSELNFFLNFNLPENFKIKKINCPFLWTQIGLSFELFKNPIDAFFAPVQILPNIYPKNSIVTIHGLEYEKYPQFYSLKFRKFLSYATKRSAKKAEKIIVPSESVKNDLIEYYNADLDKIFVIHHGVEKQKNIKTKKQKSFYILYLGRIEEKKNLINAVKVFNLLKEKYKIPHKFILAGSVGYLCEKIFNEAAKSKFKDDIIFMGYVSEEEKWQLLNGADIFYFVSWYEGFGMPILEAQSVGVPVITSNISSMPEVAGKGCVFVRPDDIEEISETIYRILSNQSLKNALIKLGFENTGKFNWKDAAQKTFEVITK